MPIFTTVCVAVDVVRLPEVVVTPSRAEADPFQLPYSVQRLDRDRLQLEQQARTLPEQLREVPSVMIQKTAQGQGSPFIRGFTGFRTLLRVDGFRLNNSVFREGPNQYWNTVDLHSLARLEVGTGPGSVLHGSDAIGGTLNALTLAPAERAGTDQPVASRARATPSGSATPSLSTG